MLDIECFTFLNRALESSISPIVILASNRGQTQIRGLEDASSSKPQAQTYAHGIPPDLLARLLIIPTHPYSHAEILSILRLRAKTEALTLADHALEELGRLGVEVSLRYALQLLGPADVLARVRTGAIKSGGKAGGGGGGGGGGVMGATAATEITVEDVVECKNLFIDAKRSAQVLKQGGGLYID